MRCHHSFIAAFICAIVASAAFGQPTPVGIWRVIGDVSGEAEALVAISERDDVFEGRIVKVFSRPGVDPDAVCELCPGARRNQPVRGLTILSGLRRNGDDYTGGDILDPDTGEIYRCKLTLSADNRRLMVRGFVGISLFGRTQTWIGE
jgi:uncharacterized protein (DUF2147 family)